MRGLSIVVVFHVFFSVPYGHQPFQNRYSSCLVEPDITNIKIHSSCEIENFVATHLCKLCVILRSRVLRVVCRHEGYRSATPLGTKV